MLIQELSSLLEMRMTVAEFSDKPVGEREQILWQWAKGGMNAISLKEWKTYLNAHIKAQNLKEEFQAAVPTADLPKNVLDAVAKVQAVLKQHKINGARISVDHHDYEPQHEKQSGGHYEINIELGSNVDNDDLLDDLQATQPHKWTHRKGDIMIAPCGSIHPAPKNVIR